MWSQQCYTGFNRAAKYYAQLHLHSGKLDHIFTVDVVRFLFTKLLISSFCPQNSTTSKYHLSGITLSASWADMSGRSLPYKQLIFPLFS